MNKDYYTEQLEKINPHVEFPPTFKFIGEESTKWLSLNQESARALINWLENHFPAPKSKEIKFTKIKGDVNGNPRYVCHYLDLLSEKDKKAGRYTYEQAIKRANSIGGRKYNTNKYAGGIVFQSYNTESLQKIIHETLKNS